MDLRLPSYDFDLFFSEEESGLAVRPETDDS